MNPQGCRVAQFRQPSADELAHDFLWRIHNAVPPRGQVTIFNRSHYEDVLVVRVHNLVPERVWSSRYDQINAFEKELVENNVHILKFYLHISKEEQLKRFADRLEEPDKRWKISESDYKEREAVGRLYDCVRGRVVALQYRPRAMVRHSLGSQVVPESGDSANRRGTLGGASLEVSEALGKHRAHPSRVSFRERRLTSGRCDGADVLRDRCRQSNGRVLEAKASSRTPGERSGGIRYAPPGVFDVARTRAAFGRRIAEAI